MQVQQTQLHPARDARGGYATAHARVQNDLDQDVVVGKGTATALPEASAFSGCVHNPVQSAGQRGITRGGGEVLVLPGMVPLALRVLRMLSAGRACAEQLAARAGVHVDDIYGALVQLDARGLAWCTQHKMPIRGFGRARYWHAAGGDA